MLAAGDLITMDTSSQSNLPDNLVSGHAYMMESMTTTANGTTMVQLGNPLGNRPALRHPLLATRKGHRRNRCRTFPLNI
jgi:hypothetical protein